ncbi:MAG: hypothetical protein N0C84_00480 [Candidatus Thiodiazotropha taylori]|uniref:Uncharacterized protein n=1 Tax=Candidatus Thiodiazotropha taylori TaxID=2792791 RepID=A0A9E4K818_9GAMM|nr:hypothetical protein [Candidatus Thiodiazotropha taylori]MCW4254920.1 hypothetical protein [Candidatus Thiodiazotropha taylori]
MLKKLITAGLIATATVASAEEPKPNDWVCFNTSTFDIDFSLDSDMIKTLHIMTNMRGGQYKYTDPFSQTTIETAFGDKHLDISITGPRVEDTLLVCNAYQEFNE